jgi:hypothetical protein
VSRRSTRFPRLEAAFFVIFQYEDPGEAEPGRLGVAGSASRRRSLRGIGHDACSVPTFQSAVIPACDGKPASVLAR